MKRIAPRIRKEDVVGRDETVFGFSLRPLPVEISMRSGDRPVRPVREEKKDERTAVSSFPSPRIWDIFGN